MAGINIDEVMAKLGDEFAIPLGEDGSVKGADLKAYLTETRGGMTSRDKKIADQETEITRLRQIESQQAALFEAAARGVAADGNPPLNPRDRQQQPLSDEDAEYQALSSDPLYAPIAKRLLPRMLKEFEASLDARFKPQFDALSSQNGMVTRALLNQQTVQNYKDAGTWPEGWDLKKVHQYATEKKYLVPGGEQWGLIDVGRVHNEIVGPIERQAEIEKIRKEAKEEAMREFRAAPNVFQMPNREMGGAGKGALKAKGRTPDEIFGNSLNEAAKDMETMRQLEAIGSRR